MLTNQEKINRAVSQVHMLTNAVRELYSQNRKAFDGNKQLSKSFKDFFKITDTTIDKLNNPTLSIAMVGTTSAGKSTIVNAFAGRRVAPMNEQETSAGILKLTDSDEIVLNIEKTLGARWETGEKRGLTDAQNYEIIKDVYTKYHAAAKIKAPFIQVSGPLEWKRNKSILELPENLDVEFIDLPGLKTILDPKNLEVIQSMLSKALCIIAMDFTDVDALRIQRLLDEVKDIVKALKGNTEFLVFLLNKVDSQKSEDTPLEEKISTLSSLVSQTLGIKNSKLGVTIYPFIGHLLYLAQMSVTKGLDGEIIDFETSRIQTILEDCGNLFTKKRGLSSEDMKIFQAVRNAIENEEEITLEEVKAFYSLCVRISRVDVLYTEINRRVAESFEHIVIRPILDDFKKYIVKLMGEVTLYININKTNSLIDLVSEKIGILKSKIFIEGTSELECIEKFKNEISDIRNLLVTLNSVERTDEENFILNRIAKDLRKLEDRLGEQQLGYIDQQINDITDSIENVSTELMKLKNDIDVVKYLTSKSGQRAIRLFNGLSDVPKTIKKKLISKHLDPFRSNIAQKIGKGKYISIMGEAGELPSPLIHELGDTYGNLYELFYTTLSKFTKEGDMFVYKTEHALSDQWDKDVKNVGTCVDRRIRDVLSKITNISFQQETAILLGGVENYFNEELKRILGDINARTQLKSGDIASLLSNALEVSKAPLLIPETLFEFSTPKGASGWSGFIKTVSEEKYVLIEEHSCSDDEYGWRTVTRDVYGYTYKYENEIGRYNRWCSAIDNTIAVFWAIVNEWLQNQVSIFMNRIKKASVEVSEMIDTLLIEKAESVINNQLESEKFYQSLQDKVNKINNDFNVFIGL